MNKKLLIVTLIIISSIFLVSSLVIGCFLVNSVLALESHTQATVKVLGEAGPGTPFTKYVEIYDSDRDLIRIWGSGEIWDSYGGKFENYDEIGKIRLISDYLKFKNYGGGDRKFNLYGKIESDLNYVSYINFYSGISGVEVPVVSENNEAGVNVKGRLDSLYMSNDLIGNFDINVGRLDSFKSDDIEDFVDINGGSYIGYIYSGGKFSGNVKASQIATIKSSGDLTGQFNSGFISWLGSVSGKVYDTYVEGDINTLYAFKGMENINVNGYLTKLLSKNNVKNCFIKKGNDIYGYGYIENLELGEGSSFDYVDLYSVKNLKADYIKKLYVYGKEINNAEISSSNSVFAREKIYDLRVKGDVNYLSTNGNAEKLNITGNIVKLTASLKISNSFIGSENSDINYVSSRTIEKSSFNGNRIGEIVTDYAYSINMTADNIEKLYFKTDANDINVKADSELTYAYIYRGVRDEIFGKKIGKLVIRLSLGDSHVSSENPFWVYIGSISKYVTDKYVYGSSVYEVL